MEALQKPLELVGELDGRVYLKLEDGVISPLLWTSDGVAKIALPLNDKAILAIWQWLGKRLPELDQEHAQAAD